MPIEHRSKIGCRQIVEAERGEIHQHRTILGAVGGDENEQHVLLQIHDLRDSRDHPFQIVAIGKRYRSHRVAMIDQHAGTAFGTEIAVE